MKISILFFTFTLIGVNCVIQNGDKTLRKILEMVSVEGGKLHELEHNRQLLEDLKKKYKVEHGSESKGFTGTKDYRRLMGEITRLEGELALADAQISKLFDELIETNRKNREEITKMKNDLVDGKNKIRRRRSFKMKVKEHKIAKLNEDLLLVQEKERYILLEAEMIEVLKGQLIIKQKLMTGLLKDTSNITRAFQAACLSLRSKLELVNSNRPRDLPSTGEEFFWNNMDLKELKKHNDANEMMVREMQPLIEELRSLMI